MRKCVWILAVLMAALALTACSGGGGGGGGGGDMKFTALRGTCNVNGVATAGVTVTVGDKSAVSDSDGKYDIRGVATGTHTCRAVYGSRSASITLSWREGEYTKNDWSPQL